MDGTEDRNILLYWDDQNIDPSASLVVKKWRSVCTSWNTRVHSLDSGYSFLQEEYGRDIANGFLSCAVPAMRSDFFRVFWILSKGGIYSDFTFIPKREPLFFNASKNITVARWSHGRIVNGVFFAKRDCNELKVVAFEMLKAISRKNDNNIWSATGPGAWIRALGGEQTDDLEIIDQSDLFKNFLAHSGYNSSTRNTGNHWSEVQKHTSIYCVP
jgi:hypothetical protein